MSNWHKLFYYLQFTVLVFFLTFFFVEDLQKKSVFLFLFTAVYFTEFVILECQRKMNKNLIYYRKSGFFALLDLLSVTIFVAYSWICTYGILFSKEFSLYTIPLSATLIYTLIRKIYIFKNYTY